MSNKYITLLIQAVISKFFWDEFMKITWVLWISLMLCPLSVNAVEQKITAQDIENLEGVFSQVISQRAQKSLLSSGTVVTTGFSGHKEIKPFLGRPTTDKEKQRVYSDDFYKFIDLDGASATLILPNKIGHTFNGNELGTPVFDKILARDVGQVFGIAIDDAEFPNLYLSASSVFGLQIIGSDKNNDLVPDRLLSGSEDAVWMSGQWGGYDVSGPGTIYKIDGKTGQIEIFANVELNGRANSGASLGNLTYDSQHKQLFVSDRETGMIHRIDAKGNDLQQFDHGVEARALNKMFEVEFDVEQKINLSDPTFEVENPESWNFAAAERRIWGLAVHHSRLYYSVADGPAIWSVGINKKTGEFLPDARWELTLSEKHPQSEISDIVFSKHGEMILAQRGDQIGDFNYKKMAVPLKAETLKFVLEYPEDKPETLSIWVEEPQILAIGFYENLNNGLGGVAIGPGYDNKGEFNWRACGETLWVTGENLRKDINLFERLIAGGRLAIDGLQASPIGMQAHLNSPPWFSYMQDYDGALTTDLVAGHVGDVEVLGCRSGKLSAGGNNGGGSSLGDIPDKPLDDLLTPFPELPPIPPVLPEPDCVKVESKLMCNSNSGGYVLTVNLTDQSGGSLDMVKISDPNDSVLGLPKSELYPGEITVDLLGYLGGATKLDLCAYDGVQKKLGMPYSCCKASVEFEMPTEICVGVAN